MTPNEALRYAIAKIGPEPMAKGLGITRQALSQWERCPVMRVLKVEELSGVPRWELRPDVYPAPAQGEAAA